MKDVFYVGVNYPNSVRKTVLESMREVVLVLKGYDNFRLKRMEKATKITNLQNIVKEIDSLFSKFKRDMPKSGARVNTVSRSHNKSRKKIRDDSSHRSHVNKLAKELEEIESRLNQFE